ncbi:MAG: enolase C-terminal domain-like protein [Nannocystaceae bacterium]
MNPSPRRSERPWSRIRAAYGLELSILLDVNRGWSKPDAEANLARLVGVGPEYVEEPCADWGQLDSPLPLAADESLVGADDRAVERGARGRS